LQKKSNGVVLFLDEWEFLIAPLIFTALAFFTRMWKIGISDIVTWDEAQYAMDRLPTSTMANFSAVLASSDHTT